MANEPTIKVEGLNKVVKQIGQLSPDLKKEMKEANKEQASRLVPLIASRAPRRTGKLASSVRAGATQRSGVVRMGKKTVPYAGPIHFGWPARNISPNPFMWQVLDSRRAQIQKEYLERIQDLASRVR